MNMTNVEEGSIISVNDHFSNDGGFYSKIASMGLRGNPWDIANALKGLGVDEDSAFNYAADPKSIPNKLKLSINEKISPKEGVLKFKIRNIETIKGSSRKIPRYDIKDFIKTIEKMGFTTELYFEKSEKYIFSPVSSSFIQGVGYIGTGKSVNEKAWKNFHKKGIYGSAGKEFTYFSNDMEVALSHAPYDDTALIEINIPELSRHREIFSDPESSYVPSEKNKTFVVMGGIPKEAITKIYHMSEVR